MNSCHCCYGFMLVDVPGPEEELPVEVALLDHVHVGDGDTAALGGVAAKAHEGKVFEEFTTNGSGSDNKPFLFSKSFLELFSKDCNLSIIPKTIKINKNLSFNSK